MPGCPPPSTRGTTCWTSSCSPRGWRRWRWVYSASWARCSRSPASWHGRLLREQAAAGVGIRPLGAQKGRCWRRSDGRSGCWPWARRRACSSGPGQPVLASSCIRPLPRSPGWGVVLHAPGAAGHVDPAQRALSVDPAMLMRDEVAGQLVRRDHLPAPTLDRRHVLEGAAPRSGCIAHARAGRLGPGHRRASRSAGARTSVLAARVFSSISLNRSGPA